MSDNFRSVNMHRDAVLTRRGGMRVVAQGLCTEINEDAEQLGLMIDVSEQGLRLERPHMPGLQKRRERIVQLEFEHPSVDELIWAKGVIRFDRLEPYHEGQRLKVRRTSGVEIVQAAGRHLRLLRDFVFDMRSAMQQEREAPLVPMWSTAFRLG
jgi:hypothetical protein